MNTKFEQFQKVLVRDNIGDEWNISLYSHYGKGMLTPHVCINGIPWRYCVPYKGNENLVGTSDSPDCQEEFEFHEDFKFGDKVMVSDNHTDWIKATFVEYMLNNNSYHYRVCTPNCIYYFKHCRKGWDDDSK